MTEAYDDMTDYIISVFKSDQSRLRKQMLKNISLLPPENQVRIIKKMVVHATSEELISALPIIRNFSNIERKLIAEEMLNENRNIRKFTHQKHLLYSALATLIMIQDTPSSETSFSFLINALREEWIEGSQKEAILVLNELLLLLSTDCRIELTDAVRQKNDRGNILNPFLRDAIVKSVAKQLQNEKPGSLSNDHIFAYFKLNIIDIQDVLETHIIRLEPRQKVDILSKILFSTSVSIKPQKRLEYSSLCLQIPGCEEYEGVFGQLIASLKRIPKKEITNQDIRHLRNCFRNLAPKEQAKLADFDNDDIQKILDAHIDRLKPGQKADILDRILRSPYALITPQKRLEYASFCLQNQEQGSETIFQELKGSMERIPTDRVNDSEIRQLDECFNYLSQSQQIQLAEFALNTQKAWLVQWSDNVMERIFRVETQRALSAPSKESALLTSGDKQADASSFIIIYPGSGANLAPQVGVNSENVAIFFEKYAGIGPKEKKLVDKTLDQFFIMGKREDVPSLIDTTLNASELGSSGPFICKMMQCIGSGDRFKLTSDQVILAARSLIDRPQYEESFAKALVKMVENKQIDDFFTLESALSKNGGSVKPEHRILSELMSKNQKLSGLCISTKFSTPNQSNWVQKLKQKLSFSKV